jgi:hypothetical protein
LFQKNFFALFGHISLKQVGFEKIAFGTVFAYLPKIYSPKNCIHHGLNKSFTNESASNLYPMETPIGMCALDTYFQGFHFLDAVAAGLALRIPN